MRGEYVPERYWTVLHEEAEGERAVGYPNLATSINRARYDVERSNVSRALDDVGIDSPAQVLDVGSGTGVWIDFWRHRGAHDITGVDIAEVAVARLRARMPDHRFICADICDPAGSLPAEVDVVSAMSVLLHVTDDRRFETGLRNLLSCVRTGGAIVLVEPIIVHRWWGPPFGPEDSSKARPLEAYTSILHSAGFEVRALRPSSCVLINPIDTKRPISFRLLSRYWHELSRVVGTRERLGRAAGPVLRTVDLLATRVVRPGPSAKILVAQRVSVG